MSYVHIVQGGLGRFRETNHGTMAPWHICKLTISFFALVISFAHFGTVQSWQKTTANLANEWQRKSISWVVALSPMTCDSNSQSSAQCTALGPH